MELRRGAKRRATICCMPYIDVPGASLYCEADGSIAIDIAVESPKRVTGLVTIGSGPSVERVLVD